jgi:hypothetical protein
MHMHDIALVVTDTPFQLLDIARMCGMKKCSIPSAALRNIAVVPACKNLFQSISNKTQSCSGSGCTITYEKGQLPWQVGKPQSVTEVDVTSSGGV